MAANSFSEVTRSLRLYVPQLPIFLAQQFVRDRYRRILERRPWSALREQNAFLLDAQKTTGTVTVTRNDTTVVGASTTWLSTDVGRQFKAGSGNPIYTIVSVDVGLQELELDQVWGGLTGVAQSFVIFDGYVTCPADFLRFISIVDPQQGYRLRHWVGQDELNAWDPQRTFFGQPYMLVDRKLLNGLIQYEAWPYATSKRDLVYYYQKRGADLIDDADLPIYPVRSDAIVSGALADLCRWPGTSAFPNPMFGKMDVQRSFEAEYEDKMIDLERQDEDIYLTWLQYPLSSMTFPMSASWIQSHAV